MLLSYRVPALRNDGLSISATAAQPQLYREDERVKSLQCHCRSAAGLVAHGSMHAVLR